MSNKFNKILRLYITVYLLHLFTTGLLETMSRKNYTEKEKRELLSIVDKYKVIIENKSTNAVTVEKKNETWEKIAQEYNSFAENPRTAKQLNTAYQNLKRLTRQKTADDNMQNYIEKNILQSDLKKFKKDNAEDKKAIMATGGGTFTPQLSEVGAQMLALMGDQLTPLSNDCDSAAVYFRKEDDVTNDGENINAVIVQEIDNHKNEDSAEPLLEKKKELQKKTNPNLHSRGYLKQKKVKNTSAIKKKFDSTSAIKRKFYQKKLECALIEKRTNLLNYRITMKKQKLIDLEIKIKELELLNSK